MDFRYVFVYAMVNVFCLGMCLVIFPKLSYNVGSELEIKYFRRMLVCFAAFLVMELVWILSVGGGVMLPKKMAGYIKMADTAVIPVMVYSWFWFAEIKFRSSLINRKWLRAVTAVPLFVMGLLYFVSLYDGIVFRVASNGELIAGPLAGITGLVDNIYGISIVVHAIILLMREKANYRKHDYTSQIIFIAICTLGGITDMIVRNTPVMPLAIALSFCFLFDSLQEHQIYNDALTGLNNRRRADRFIEEQRLVASETNPFYLFVMDVDHFKQINDTRGHLEGDRALQTVASAINQVTGEFDGFCARWGGDEFLVIVHSTDELLPGKYVPAVQEALDRLTLERGLQYRLSVSAGYTRCSSTQRLANELVYEADQMLYEKKRKAKKISILSA